MDQIFLTHYHSPAGHLIIGTWNNTLCLCDWHNNPHRTTIDHRLTQQLKATTAEHTTPTALTAITHLEEYFAGQRTTFDLPITLTGSQFQQQILQQLSTIDYGTTCSYSHIAQLINHPQAVRAVANAISHNPLSIIIPCHRVIGKNKHLTGYAGGPKTKEYLLKLEHII